MRTLLHTCRALALVAAVIGAGCGMRTSIQAEADIEDDPFGGASRPCGMGPPCNPSDVGGRTCESLGLASGVVSCDPETCNLDISGCGDVIIGGGASGSNPIGTGSPGTPGLFGAGGTGTGTGGLFGAGQGGLFGTGADGGLFGAGNIPDGGFFGMGNNDPDEDGGIDDPGGGGGGTSGGTGGTGGTTGFFGGNFFGGGNGGGLFGSGFFGGQ